MFLLVAISLVRNVDPVFLDTINFAICKTVNEYLGERAAEFFGRVGEHHLDEATRRGLFKIGSEDKPMDALMRIANYLEASGYMDHITINRLSETEASVEMYGVSVSDSSIKILREKSTPSHYMTNLMVAALKKFGVHAELKDVEFDEQRKEFKEHWRILASPR